MLDASGATPAVLPMHQQLVNPVQGMPQALPYQRSPIYGNATTAFPASIVPWGKGQLIKYPAGLGLEYLIPKDWGKRFITKSGIRYASSSVDSVAEGLLSFVLKRGVKVSTVAEVGIGTSIDVIHQIVDDWNDPYLSPLQRYGRSGIAAGGSLLATGLGSATAYLIIGSTPPGWLVVTAVFTYDFLIGEFLLPIVYDLPVFNPARNLRVLEE